VSTGIRIDADRAGRFVPAATDVKNPFPDRRHGRAFILPWPIPGQKEEVVTA
jgi:hypothetical protein